MRNAGIALALLAMSLLIPQTAAGIGKRTDLTNLFLAGGVDIDRLRVSEAGGVVVIHGRTSDQALADQAGAVAANLGYLHVANRIEIVPALADDAIAAFAMVELRRARELEGCTFAVETRNGIVYLLGEVDREPQKAIAVRLVGRIDGVKEVRSGLTRLK
jgi:osmotically-inducible protein OsmY